MHELRVTLENALALAKNGRRSDALEQMVTGLEAAISEKNLRWISL
jgi:hypothetical protein